MSNPVSQEKLDEIKKSLFAGRKIEAIKLYREGAEVGLAEAKDAVEKMETELRKSASEQFVTNSTSKGCFGMLAMACVIVAAALLLLMMR